MNETNEISIFHKVDEGSTYIPDSSPTSTGVQSSVPRPDSENSFPVKSENSRGEIERAGQGSSSSTRISPRGHKPSPTSPLSSVWRSKSFIERHNQPAQREVENCGFESQGGFGAFEVSCDVHRSGTPYPTQCSSSKSSRYLGRSYDGCPAVARINRFPTEFPCLQSREIQPDGADGSSYSHVHNPELVLAPVPTHWHGRRIGPPVACPTDSHINVRSGLRYDVVWPMSIPQVQLRAVARIGYNMFKQKVKGMFR